MNKVEYKNSPEKLNPLDIIQEEHIEAQDSPELKNVMDETSEATAEILGEVSESNSKKPSENKSGGATTQVVKDRQAIHMQKIEAHIQSMSSEQLCKKIQHKYEEQLAVLDKQVKKMRGWFAKSDPAKMTELLKQMREIYQKIKDLAEMTLENLRTVYRNLIFAK